MIQRITSGWTFIRVLYLVLGVFVIAQSIHDKQWVGLVLGAYVAAMGLFAFGCAAGNCYRPSFTPPKEKSKMQDREFEEIKSK
jgi:hypothetical protein